MKILYNKEIREYVSLECCLLALAGYKKKEEDKKPEKSVGWFISKQERKIS